MVGPDAKLVVARRFARSAGLASRDAKPLGRHELRDTLTAHLEVTSEVGSRQLWGTTGEFEESRSGVHEREDTPPIDNRKDLPIITP